MEQYPNLNVQLVYRDEIFVFLRRFSLPPWASSRFLMWGRAWLGGNLSLPVCTLRAGSHWGILETDSSGYSTGRLPAGGLEGRHGVLPVILPLRRPGRFPRGLCWGWLRGCRRTEACGRGGHGLVHLLDRC